MSGILANSTSKTMVSGDTSADKSVSGYITGEQITLSVYPAATSSVAWAEAIPSGSAAARSALSASTGTSVSFTPDVGGFYTITALVDGVTTYVLRLSVSAVAVSTPEEVLRLQQVTDAQVPAPSGSTLALYNSNEHYGLVTADSGGVVTPIGVRGTIGANLTDADETLALADGVNRSIQAGTLTASRVKSLSVAGASNAARLWIYRYDVSANTVDVHNAAGSVIFTFPASQAYGAGFFYDGQFTNDWIIYEHYPLA